MVNTMLNKTLTIYITNPYLLITDAEKYYSHPVKMYVMKCLVSKEHHCFISGGLNPVQGSTDCAQALDFNDYNATKSHCSLTFNTITKIQ